MQSSNLAIVRKRLEKEFALRNNKLELSSSKPDPLLVAREYKDEYIALICALFGYGNAKLIVNFLNSLDFTLLDRSEKEIQSTLAKHCYRFQKPQDVIDIFITIKRLKEIDSIESIVYSGYKKEHNILEGLSCLIFKIRSLHPATSYGYNFFSSNL